MQITRAFSRVVVSLGKKDEDSRTITIVGKKDNLDALEVLFHWIQSCGDVGHSGSAIVSVDGDGAARVKFEGLKEDSYERPEPKSSGDPELSVDLS